MKKLDLRSIYHFNLLWLMGCLHILYYGLRPYKHYMYEEMLSPDIQAVMMTLALFSVFFIAGNIVRQTTIWKKIPYWCYFFLSSVLIFQSFIAFIEAMHAPPYWGAFIINCLLLLLLYFVFYPIYRIHHKQF